MEFRRNIREPIKHHLQLEGVPGFGGKCNPKAPRADTVKCPTVKLGILGNLRDPLLYCQVLHRGHC